METGLFPPSGHDTQDQPFRRGNFAFAYAWLEGVDSLDALLAYIDGLRATDPDHRYLCTLDDINQCNYTCGHAGNDERLSLDAPNDMDWDDPVQQAAWQLASLQHRVQQLAKPELAQTWASVCGTLNTGGDDVETLLTANHNPNLLVEDVIYVQRLPVEADDLLIAGQPNGYFSADWDSFQNHAIIRHLATQYGYRFFGMGAAWMGFVRPAPLAPDQGNRLVGELRDLYGRGNDEAADHEAWAALAQVLQARRTLLLGYIENMAESLMEDDEEEDDDN